MRWEYKAVRGASLADLVDELTALGAAEWEAVGAVADAVEGTSRGVEVLLKRVGKSGAVARQREARGRWVAAGQRARGDVG